MGSELAADHEWDFKSQLDWAREKADRPKGVERLLRDLNRLYEREPALSQKQFDADGNDTFLCDKERAVVGMVRRGENAADAIVFVHNLTETPRTMRIGVDAPGRYGALLNTDAAKYGGSGVAPFTHGASSTFAEAIAHDGKPCSIEVTLPPLATIALKKKE